MDPSNSEEIHDAISRLEQDAGSGHEAAEEADVWVVAEYTYLYEHFDELFAHLEAQQRAAALLKFAYIFNRFDELAKSMEVLQRLRTEFPEVVRSADQVE